MVVFFIIDVSGSMRGERMEAVNAAIRGVLPDMARAEAERGAEILIAEMEFSSAARWRTQAPEPASLFRHEDITDVGGGTNYSRAFAALREDAPRLMALCASGGSYAPLIVMITDGKPSDPALCGDELALLRNESWFAGALKAGVAIGEGAASGECASALAEFTGDKSTVFAARDISELGRLVGKIITDGIDASIKRGPTPGKRAAARRRPPRNDSPFAPQRVADEIPGLEDIDWERDFPVLGQKD